MALSVGRKNSTVSTSGKVEALVEEVGGEEHVYPSGPEVVKRALAQPEASCHYRGDGIPAFVESGHELRMRHTDAEPKGSHRGRVENLVAHLLQHECRASVVAGIDVGQLDSSYRPRVQVMSRRSVPSATAK